MRPVLLVALVLLLWPAIAAAQRQDPDGFTPVVPSVVAPPWPVEGSDGRMHFVYEVQLVNSIPIPRQQTRVIVRSSRGRVLATWRGRRVRTIMRSLAGGRDTARIGGGEVELLHLAFSVRTRIPGSLVHELRLANPNPRNGAPARATVI